MNKISIVISNEGTDVIKQEIAIENNNVCIKFLEKLDTLLKETKDWDFRTSVINSSKESFDKIFENPLKDIFGDPFDNMFKKE